MVIKFPPRFSGGGVHSIWSDVQSVSRSAGTDDRRVLLDLSGIRYIDAEGCNYLALIPVYLAQQRVDVRIELPQNEHVVGFMGVMGLLDHYSERYKVLGLSQQAMTHFTVMDIVAGRRERLLSRRAQLCVFERATFSDVFRLRFLRDSVLAFGSEVEGSLCTALAELISNVFDHSGESTGCVAFQMHSSAGRRQGESLQIWFALSDLGIGIRRSIGPQFVAEYGLAAVDRDDAEYLRFALTPGVSRTGVQPRGYGLPTVARLANTVRLASGNAAVRVKGDLASISETSIASIPGTSAVVTFNVSSDDGGGGLQYGAAPP